MSRRAELDGFRNATVPDLIGEGTRLLFVGINPGLWTAAVGAHFAHPANRFYRALHEAGITGYRIDARQGLHPEDLAHLLDRGVGITNLVERATARAAELAPAELRRGAERLTAKVTEWRPRVVAVVGLTAYRTAFRRANATAGPQPEAIAGRPLWALPNPSGLNAHETATSLASAYRSAADAAGLPGLPGRLETP